MVEVDKLNKMKTFDEFQKAFSEMDASQVGEILNEALSAILEGQNPVYSFNINFFSAGIDRLFEFGFKQSDFSPDQKEACVGFAEHIIKVTRSRFSKWPDVLERFDKAIANARNYYDVIGRHMPLYG